MTDNLNDTLLAVSYAYSHATNKHPHFARTECNSTAAEIKNRLAMARAKSDHDQYCIEYTLDEEVAEVYEAFVDRNYRRAWVELAQVAAVVLRAMQYIQTTYLTDSKEDSYETH